jgi:methylthioribose-1-phosphate isomerase
MTAPMRDSAPTAALVGVQWEGGLDDGTLVLIDQVRLPKDVVHLRITTLEVLRQAICDLSVRGAPAISIAAAYGVVLEVVTAARSEGPGASAEVLEPRFEHACERLVSSRPTAVNLRWAIQRMRECYQRHVGDLTALEMCARLLLEAKRIQREDQELCRRIAEHGAALLPDSGGVYTHCNTGALATGGVGTALGCLVEAFRGGKSISVFAGETRPLFQGARLTALELTHAQVPVTLCCDSAAGSLMARGMIQAVIVGADRICANGDTANKIGTYALAVLARHHGIPFYVAAPYSTFDLTLRDGSLIHIEERHGDEVRRPMGVQTSPAQVAVANPAFDVTPAALITAIITERGVIAAPTTASVERLMGHDGERRSAV